MRLQSIYQSLDHASAKPLRKYQRYLNRINRYRDQLRCLSDNELKVAWQKECKQWSEIKPTNFKQTIIIFAYAREVTYRLTGKFQYDVQVLGALAMIDRNAVQMSTGSGKTLTLILPCVAFGLTHQGVYALTVNDYLSQRDWNETKSVYEWFGLSTAYTNSDQDPVCQREAFDCDVIYCTNSALGFAYLNSALASDIGPDIKILHRPLYSAIIDECDEILMDDARNPLIIADSTPSSQISPTVTYDGKTHSIQKIVDKLKTLHTLELDDDDSSQQPYLNDKSLLEIQQLLQIHENMFANSDLMHVIYSAVQAIFNNQNYRDYVITKTPDPDTGSRITLIDKATGRLAKGRTMNDGMHAFLEMKEGVYSGQGTQSSIQITYQILFNMFQTIAGVSGTLGSSFKEFQDIYGMDPIIIPDRLPNIMTQKTRLYTTNEHRNLDLIRLINFYVSAHRPILIGAKSDIHARMLSDLLDQHQISHRMLISIDHNEDEVISNAGEPGSIVVTTDIMGRGTDIKPSDTAGERGLVVLQIGLRPNSRVERQFAGRAARQGQPGHYERLLALSDLLDINLSKDDRRTILNSWHEYKTSIEHYYSDILLNGKNPQYNELVALINNALVAEESRMSTTRVDDFKAYSIVDLMQISICRRMDALRLALKQSLVSTTETDALYPLIQLLAENAISKKAANRQRQIQKYIDELKQKDPQQLRIAAYNYIYCSMHKVIPALRSHSENIIDTVKLASMVQYAESPESLVIRLLQEYLEQNCQYVLFDFDKLNRVLDMN